MIYCKGMEGFHMIIHKTLLVLQYLIQEKNRKYDYVIRTNISTILQYSALQFELNNIPKQNIYIGGNRLNLKWCNQTDPNVIKHQLYGLDFVQGSSIVFSFDVVQFLLNHLDQIPMYLSDDVAFAVFIRDNHKVAYDNLAKHKLSFSQDPNSSSVFIRNRTSPNYETHEDRSFDIEKMISTVAFQYSKT